MSRTYAEWEEILNPTEIEALQDYNLTEGHISSNEVFETIVNQVTTRRTSARPAQKQLKNYRKERMSNENYDNDFSGPRQLGQAGI